jgi:hypothetical protein
VGKNGWQGCCWGAEARRGERRRVAARRDGVELDLRASRAHAYVDSTSWPLCHTASLPRGLGQDPRTECLGPEPIDGCIRKSAAPRVLGAPRTGGESRQNGPSSGIMTICTCTKFFCDCRPVGRRKSSPTTAHQAPPLNQKTGQRIARLLFDNGEGVSRCRFRSFVRQGTQLTKSQLGIEKVCAGRAGRGAKGPHTGCIVLGEREHLRS